MVQATFENFWQEAVNIRNPDKVASSLRRVARLYSTRARIHMFKTEPDLDAALQDIDHAIGLDPSFHFIHATRAGILERLQRYPEAIAAANTALALNPPDAMAFSTLAVASAYLGDFESADTALVQLQKLHPGLFHDAAPIVQKLKDKYAKN